MPTQGSSAGLGSSIVGALDALLVGAALLVGLPWLISGNDLVLILVVPVCAGGTFLLARAAAAAAMHGSRARMAVLGGAILLANLLAVGIAAAGLARMSLQ
jgi:hypothetical protein